MRRALAILCVSLLALVASAQSLHVNDSGTWRQPTHVYVNDSGTWRDIQQIYVNDGGTWRTVFLVATYATPSGMFSDTGTASGSNAAQIAVSFTSAGAYSVAGGNSGTQSSGSWVTPTSLAPGAYTIRAHANSGSWSGSALDSDLALSSSRQWTINIAGVGSASGQLALTLKDGGGNTLATGTIDATVEVLPL